MDPERQLFGIQRFVEMVKQYQELPPHEMIQRFRAEVASFARGVPQADDLTAIVIQCHPEA